jgi:CheY-like chemotaxis protein
MDTNIELTNNKTFKILVVDDNKTNIQIIGNILKKELYSVGFAFDGQQALKSLQYSPDYDLILLDVDMPVLDGFKTCVEIKKDEKLKDIPIIFLTAYNESINILEGLDLGAQDYITKPVNTLEMLTRIKTQLQIKQNADLVKKYAVKLEELKLTNDNFFSIVREDLKNPFVGIQMLSELLLKNLTKHSYAEIETIIKEIHLSAKHGNTLFENFLLCFK